MAHTFALLPGAFFPGLGLLEKPLGFWRSISFATCFQWLLIKI